MTALDKNIQVLVKDHGAKEVLASLCRECHRIGLERLFTKLNKVYEQIK